MQRKSNVFAVLCCLGWAACSDEGVEPNTNAGAQSTALHRSDRAPAAAPDADLPYLVDPQSGRIVREIPPAVLSDILAQLKRRGMGREFEGVQRLYDGASGRVRDPGRAEEAESRGRSPGQHKEGRHDAQD
jgi:hypothetical protein